MLKEILKEKDKLDKKDPTVGVVIEGVLPELMNRNTKLGVRLKSKLKVSSLLNNIELRNQNYLKELVSSSDRTVQDLKSGLELSKAMKLSSDKLSLLNSKILNDCFMKKNNIIYNTKKNLNKNTEEETNLIIKKSLSVIRDCISPTYKIIKKPKSVNEKKKYLSEIELNKAKMIINNKILVEEKILKEKIQNYLEKLKTLNITSIKSKDIYDYKIQKVNKDKNRDFYFYAKHLDLNDNNIKMIYYKKLKPQPIRDRSCPNLENIKENLFPNIKTGQINSENYVNINNSNGVKIINGMKFYKKFKNKKKPTDEDESIDKINKSDIIINNKKDSFNILKKIILRNRCLLNKNINKYKKLSTILDINLPKISDYENMINKNKIEEEKNKENEINKENIIRNDMKNKIEIPNIYSDNELMNEFESIKNEIKFLKEKKFDLDENYKRHQEKLENIVYIFEKKTFNKKKDNLINNEGLVRKKIFTKNPMIRMPSSHSVSILKRKFKIHSGISNKYNRNYRNYSKHTRDRTSASTLKNSASSIITTNKSENKYKELFNCIKNEKKYLLENNLENTSLFSQKERMNNYSKNNINSSNITSLSDI